MAQFSFSLKSNISIRAQGFFVILKHLFLTLFRRFATNCLFFFLHGEYTSSTNFSYFSQKNEMPSVKDILSFSSRPHDCLYFCSKIRKIWHAFYKFFNMKLFEPYWEFHLLYVECFSCCKIYIQRKIVLSALSIFPSSLKIF